jgi:hypothetical protein
MTEPFYTTCLDCGEAVRFYTATNGTLGAMHTGDGVHLHNAVPKATPPDPNGPGAIEMDATDAALTEAFHLLFDIKDEARDANKVDSVAGKCYTAINAIKDVMKALGYTPPTRYDGDGR